MSSQDAPPAAMVDVTKFDADQLRTLLRLIAGDLHTDELRILCMSAQRALRGQDAYGALDVRGDKRKWRRETLEEILDAQFYCSAELMRLGDEDD